jgi:hypothetical protein
VRQASAVSEIPEGAYSVTIIFVFSRPSIGGSVCRSEPNYSKEHRNPNQHRPTKQENSLQEAKPASDRTWGAIVGSHDENRSSANDPRDNLGSLLGGGVKRNVAPVTMRDYKYLCRGIILPKLN